MELSYNNILVEKENGVTTVKFNRPEKKNAMTPELHREMVDVLAKLKWDDETNVLVITGAGDSFCAGQDLKEYFYKDLHEKKDPHAHQKNRELSHTWRFRELRYFPKPTIAAVNGHCFGGAFTIVTSCDLAIAAKEAKFGLSEINFGHFAGGMVTKVVSEILHSRDALYYLFTGDIIMGDKAAELKLVNFAVPRAELAEATRALANKLSEKDPVALRFQKELYRYSLNMDYEEAWRYAGAKSSEHSYYSKGNWLEQGIGQFLDGKYKPGLGAYDKEAGRKE